jgi:hypothetical protein
MSHDRFVWKMAGVVLIRLQVSLFSRCTMVVCYDAANPTYMVSNAPEPWPCAGISRH